MHIEVQVALNFLISFLYNKLPRRRVNQFGEELEATLKCKFEGHWYPEQPYKGSAFRCIRCAPPLDPFVFEVAARKSGMNLLDIQDNLPPELSIWVDPGEVSYRMSEKGAVKILFSERNRIKDPVTENVAVSALNPEAQCFKPIDHLTNGNANIQANQMTPQNTVNLVPSPVTPVVGKPSHPVTYTAATFAATKFGSTKLKTNGKKGQRNSPTDFGLFLKPKQSQMKDNCQWTSRRTGGSFCNNYNFNNLDLLDLSDLESWKRSSSTPTITSQLANIWAAAATKGDQASQGPLYESDIFSNDAFEALGSQFQLNLNSDSSPKNGSPPSLSMLDNSRLSLLSDRLWEEIFSVSPQSFTEVSAREPSGAIPEQATARNDPFFSSSFSLSSMSSPSLSSSNESCSLNLVNEFDSLSLNSSSSSSVGSASSASYIT